MIKFSMTMLVINILAQSCLAKTAFDPAAVIVRKSGLSEQKVTEFLRDCDSYQQTQMSMYFCAWKDLAIAEHHLENRTRHLRENSKACAKQTATRMAAWVKKRDAICQQDAAEYVGGGSDEPRQRVACMAGMTEYYARHFPTPAGCR